MFGHAIRFNLGSDGGDDQLREPGECLDALLLVDRLHVESIPGDRQAAVKKLKEMRAIVHSSSLAEQVACYPPIPHAKRGVLCQRKTSLSS